MKKILLTITALMLCFLATAQTQQGYVKTKGRMVDGKLVPGHGLKGATVCIKGRTAVLVNSDNGVFSFPTPEAQFRLDSVRKKGYRLVDMDACPKTYKYSSNPLYIVMETPEQQLQDKLNAEKKIRRNLQKQLQEKENEIAALKEKDKISLDDYHKSLQQLYDEQESNEQLISDMARRYSQLDYDQLDEFYRQVSYCIENGELTKADSLLRTRGDITKQVNTLIQRSQSLQKQKTQFQKAEAMQQTDIEEAARRCYSYYETFFVQHLNDSALYYLELRASLDTTQLEWQEKAGNFADDYLADYDKAMMYYKRGLRLSKAHPDDNLQYLISSLNNIGYIYSNLYKQDSAMLYYNQALDLAKKNYGTVHKQVADRYNNIGFVYYAAADYTQAMEYIKNAADIFEKILEPNDPTIGTAYNNIGHVYSAQGNYEEALEYYFKALSIREKAYGTEHYQIAITYNNIAYCYIPQQDYAKAVEYFKKAMQIFEKVLGTNHPSTAIVYNNLGYVYTLQDDYEKGLEYYNKALSIRKKVFGDTHNDTAISYDNIGNVYTKMGDYEKALEYNQKALAVKLVLFGPDHPELGYSYSNIGLTYFKQGKYEDALVYYSLAYELLKNGLGEDFVDTQLFKKYIENLKEKIKEQKQ